MSKLLAEELRHNLHARSMNLSNRLFHLRNDNDSSLQRRTEFMLNPLSHVGVNGLFSVSDGSKGAAREKHTNRSTPGKNRYIYPLPERPYAPVVDYEEGQNWLGHVYSSKSQRDVTTQEQPVLTMSLRRSISVASPLSRAPRSNIVLIKPFCTTLYNMTEFYPHKQSYLPAASLFRSVPVRSASHPCCELCDEPKFILLFHEQVTK